MHDGLLCSAEIRGGRQRIYAGVMHCRPRGKRIVNFIVDCRFRQGQHRREAEEECVRPVVPVSEVPAVVP